MDLSSHIYLSSRRYATFCVCHSPSRLLQPCTFLCACAIMASRLTHLPARLQCVDHMSATLRLSRSGITTFRRQDRRTTQQIRTYAGIAEFTTGSELQASIAQNLHFQPQLPSVRPQSMPYWRHIHAWKNVSEEDFLSYRWQASQSNHSQTFIANLP